ncbi:MAG: nitroreductase family protein [Candidatus Bathyarchaeia archaeon]
MSLELDDAIKGRRSIRSYMDRPIPMELVREVLEAGTWAPSAKNGQQWRFTVLTGATKKSLTDVFRRELEDLESRIGRDLMGSSLGSCGIMERAPVLVMVWNAGERGWDSEVQSVAAAIQNMLLKAYDLGLGSLWIADIYYAHERLTEHLGKPWNLMAAVALGWPTAVPTTPPRKSVDEVSEFLI